MQALEGTVTGMDYELVDVERSAAGLLRVSIDRLMPLALLYALFAVIGLVVVITRNVIA